MTALPRCLCIGGAWAKGRVGTARGFLVRHQPSAAVSLLQVLFHGKDYPPAQYLLFASLAGDSDDVAPPHGSRRFPSCVPGAIGFVTLAPISAWWFNNSNNARRAATSCLSVLIFPDPNRPSIKPTLFPGIRITGRIPPVTRQGDPLAQAPSLKRTSAPMTKHSRRRRPPHALQTRPMGGAQREESPVHQRPTKPIVAPFPRRRTGRVAGPPPGGPPQATCSYGC